jgi:hypothetical protein
MKARPNAWALIAAVYGICCVAAFIIALYNILALNNRSIGIGLAIVSVIAGSLTLLLIKRVRIEIAKREFERNAGR